MKATYYRSLSIALAAIGFLFLAQPLLAYQLEIFHEPPDQEFSINNRWSSTASHGATSQGDPVTLRWSIVPDGTTINAQYPEDGEVTSGSILRASLDGSYGSGDGGSDLTTRPWFTVFSTSFNRLSQLAGLTFVYEPNDDGVTLSSAGGSIGVRGDLRISGHAIDGQSGANTLAYNFYPSNGDMVIDTSNTNFFRPAASQRAIRNTLMHEVGHGVGLRHVSPTSQTKLMEPTITTAFEGPQIDDILALQRNYGDPLEKSGGNNTSATATDLGSLSLGGTLARGVSGSKTGLIATSDTDFISIDDDSDNDYFKFTVSSSGRLTASITPLGGTYSVGLQDQTPATFNASAQSDLQLRIYGTNGTTLLATANATAAGSIETISNLDLSSPGTYYARITGAANAVQLYRFDAVFAVPEPSTIGLVGLGLIGAVFYRRRKS